MSEEREKERTYVEDIDRSIYDFRNEEKDAYRIRAGLTPEIITEISKTKNDPAWMLEHRLKSLEIFERSSMPVWALDRGPQYGSDSDLCAPEHEDERGVVGGAGGNQGTPLRSSAYRRRSVRVLRASARSTTRSWSTTT